MDNGRNIVLGVTGGIAIYKALDLVSRLKKLDFEVDVIMTEHAQEFVRPLAFQSMSGRPVATDMFAEIAQWDIEHIALAKKADVFCIVPATANIIAKMAHGIADDMLTTTLLATRAPILIAPAMNTNMYLHTTTQENMETLRKRGVNFVNPEAGRLACGDVGVGKMAEPSRIVESILHILERNETLAGKRFLITAGPTLERIDPVRFISNNSSGKMGFALARAAARCGAEVHLVTGPVHLEEPYGVTVEAVETSQEMYEAVMRKAGESDVIIKAAAVLDYRPAQFVGEKIKKTNEALQLTFDRTTDILSELGKVKQNQLLVGFAAETSSVLEYAKDKLIRKNADMIVANDVGNPEIGFKSDMNEVILVTREGDPVKISSRSKDDVAKEIIQKISDMLK